MQGDNVKVAKDPLQVGAPMECSWHSAGANGHGDEVTDDALQVATLIECS